MEKFMTDKKVVLSLTVPLDDVERALATHFASMNRRFLEQINCDVEYVEDEIRSGSIPSAIQEIEKGLKHVSDLADLYTEVRSILVGLQKTHLEIASPSEGEKIDQVDPSGSSEPE